MLIAVVTVFTWIYTQRITMERHGVANIKSIILRRKMQVRAAISLRSRRTIKIELSDINKI